MPRKSLLVMDMSQRKLIVAISAMPRNIKSQDFDRVIVMHRLSLLLIFALS